MVCAGSLVGRDLGRFRFVERDARLRVQSRSLPVSESHLPFDVSGPGHSAGASPLRYRWEYVDTVCLRRVKGVALNSNKKLYISFPDWTIRTRGKEVKVPSVFPPSSTIVNRKYINYKGENERAR